MNGNTLLWRNFEMKILTGDRANLKYLNFIEYYKNFK